MKKYLLILLFAIIQNSFAQSGGKLENYPLDEVNIVVFPFGMDYPIKIGTVSDLGELFFEIPSKIEANIPTDVKENYFSDLSSSLFFKCNEGLDLNDVKVLNVGIIALWTKDDRYAGVLFPVSNEEIIPWLEDRFYMEPIEASFYNLILLGSEQDLSYGTECISTINLESGNVEASYSYDLLFKNGFNIVEYKIESIHKSNTKETSSIPNKVQISSFQNNISQIKWIAKYF